MSSSDQTSSAQSTQEPPAAPPRSPPSPHAAEDPPTPDYAELMRDIENYNNPAVLDRVLTKLANRSAASEESSSLPTPSPPPRQQPSNSLADRLLAVFPDACPDWTKAEAGKYEEADGAEFDLQAVVDHWLTHGYQKRVKKWQKQQQQQQQDRPEADQTAAAIVVADPDEGTIFDWRRRNCDFQLRTAVFLALADEFPSVSHRSISQIVKAFKYCLPAAYRFLYKVLAYSGRLTNPEADDPASSSSSATTVQAVSVAEVAAIAEAAGDSSLELNRLPFDCPYQLSICSGSGFEQPRLSASCCTPSVSNSELLNELKFVRSLLSDQMASVMSANFTAEQADSVSQSQRPDSANCSDPSSTAGPSSSSAVVNQSTTDASSSPQQQAATYECECCFGDFQFDQMCQCPEGHLFCRSCLAAYVKEKVFGTGRLALQCMAPDCDRLFLRSQLCLAVDQVTLAKLDERAAEDSVRSIADKLFRCPACNWGAEIDELDDLRPAAHDGAAAGPSRINNKVFTCLNCEKEVCRLCGVDWEEHFGKRCSEIECDSETRLRREFEERMTEARVRICYQCKASVMKTTGCNHITCRCGAHFCYICRSALPASDPYSHFCNLGNLNSCNCGRCPVQSSTEEDERRAIRELRAQGLKRQRDEGFQERPIGPDQPDAAKRSRRS